MSKKQISTLLPFAWFLMAFELILIFIYTYFIRNDTNVATDMLRQHYPYFQQISVMMIIGYGFIMAFLKSYEWGALGFTFLINSIVTQYYIPLHGFWNKVFNQGFDSYGFNIDITSFITASFAVATVLISYRAIIGRIDVLQILVLIIFQTMFYTINRFIVYSSLQTIDTGGSITIHTFGGFFGLAVSWVLGRKYPIRERVPRTSYHSFMYAMIGTFFLWLYYPTFNSAAILVVDTNTQILKIQAIFNTIFAISGSCLTTMAASKLLMRKLEMEDFLNSSLAGGVFIAASASIIQKPVASLFAGMFAGALSVIMFEKLTPFLTSKKFFDVCGILNQHAVPGFLGGLYSALLFGAYNTSPTKTLMNPSNHNSYGKQGGLQVAATFVTLGISIATGLFTGWILSKMQVLQTRHFFDDRVSWLGSIRYQQVREEEKQYIYRQELDDKVQTKKQIKESRQNNNLTLEESGREGLKLEESGRDGLKNLSEIKLKIDQQQ